LVAGFRIFFAVEENVSGRCGVGSGDRDAVIGLRRRKPGADCGGDVDGNELILLADGDGADCGAESWSSGESDGRFGPGSSDRKNVYGTGSVHAVDVQDQVGFGDFIGGCAGGESRKIELEQRRVAIADVEIRERAKICAGVSATDMSVGDEGDVGSVAGRRQEKR
jgi:hypothetical protein